MKIGVLGTGMVGTIIASKLVQLGHDVKMGSRSADNPKARELVKTAGGKGTLGTFADAAAFGEILFNCTHGMASVDALKQAGVANLKGKILVDIANALDFSKGMPPTLAVCNTDSLGEQIQRTFPEARVVKALNTVNCKVMVDPSLVKGEHDLFICGNDSQAKARVTEILKDWFGWKSVVDLGDMSAARATEMLLPFWLRLVGVYKTSNFNFRIVH